MKRGISQSYSCNTPHFYWICKAAWQLLPYLMSPVFSSLKSFLSLNLQLKLLFISLLSKGIHFHQFYLVLVITDILWSLCPSSRNSLFIISVPQVFVVWARNASMKCDGISYWFPQFSGIRGVCLVPACCYAKSGWFNTREAGVDRGAVFFFCFEYTVCVYVN